jgi:hypothetical protein
MVKRAIHFGVNLHESNYKSSFFDSEKDASYYHYLTIKKGFESHVLTTEKDEVECELVKGQIKQIAKELEPGGICFISLNGESINRPFKIGSFKLKTKRKWLKLSNQSFFGVKDLNECLSYFDEGKRVFFLITEIENNSTGISTNLLKAFIPSKKVKADAVVLALSTHSTMTSIDKSSLASDFNLVLETSHRMEEIKPRIDALYGSDKRVSSEVIYYNTRESSRIFI